MMKQFDWNVPKTEEGLVQVQNRIERCRQSKNLPELGHGLLALSFLVKWVRSDNETPPFLRSHELALEAVDVFREADDKKGLIDALVAASAMADPAAVAQRLSEAEELAESIEDPEFRAKVLAAKGRVFSSDPQQKEAYTEEALSIYQATGNLRGQARTTFSLVILKQCSDEEKLSLARQAAQLFQQVSEPEDAARSLSLALMYGESILSISQQIEIANEGLTLALSSESSHLIAGFYQRLSKLAIAEQRTDDAAKFLDLAKNSDSDGEEDIEDQILFMMSLIDVAKAQGNREAEVLFKAELKDLKRRKRQS